MTKMACVQPRKMPSLKVISRVWNENDTNITLFYMRQIKYLTNKL